MSDQNGRLRSASPSEGSVLARVDDVVRPNELAVRLALIAALAVVAWTNRFIQDDAFISFRYAQNLVDGHGLVWNVGEKVEGFTNPLWTLLVALCMRLGMDPISATYALGLGFFVVTLDATFRMARALTNSPAMAFCAVLLLGTNLTFSAYATGGLETQSQAAFFALASSRWIRILRAPDVASIEDYAWTSVWLGLAVLTRLDSGVIAFVFAVVTLPLLWRSAADRSAKLRRSVALGVPIGAMTSGLCLFNVGYYGHLLPNTYYAKAAGAGLGVLEHGVGYVTSFVVHYQLVALVLFVGVTAPAFLRSPQRVWALLVCVVAWASYVAKVGGDFMEYRFIVPILPIFFTCAVWAFDVLDRNIVTVTFMLATFVGDYAYWQLSHADGFIPDGLDIETVLGLKSHVEDPTQNWIGIGQALGTAFDHDPQITIAVAAAGAIPYYSKLRTIDLLGLNDEWIARHGREEGTRPGHQKRAPLSYLLDQHVALVVHPWAVGDYEENIVDYGRAQIGRYIELSPTDRIPADALIIDFPVTPTRTIHVLYLVRSPRVDAIIASHGWKTFPIHDS